MDVAGQCGKSPTDGTRIKDGDTNVTAGVLGRPVGLAWGSRGLYIAEAAVSGAGACTNNCTCCSRCRLLSLLTPSQMIW